MGFLRGDVKSVAENYGEAVRLEPLKYGIEFIDLMQNYPFSFGSPKLLVINQLELWRAHAAKTPAYDPAIRLRLLQLAAGFSEGPTLVEIELEELSVLKRAYTNGDRRFASRLADMLVFGPLPGD